MACLLQNLAPLALLKFEREILSEYLRQMFKKVQETLTNRRFQNGPAFFSE